MIVNYCALLVLQLHTLVYLRPRVNYYGKIFAKILHEYQNNVDFFTSNFENFHTSLTQRKTNTYENKTGMSNTYSSFRFALTLRV